MDARPALRPGASQHGNGHNHQTPDQDRGRRLRHQVPHRRRHPDQEVHRFLASGGPAPTERGPRGGRKRRPANDQPESFAEVADRWLAQKRPRIEASTYRDYEIHIRKRLKPGFGDLKLRQITRARIEAYLAEQDGEGKLSRKTINDSLIPLRQILGAAVREGVLATNPAKNDDRDHPLELPYERPTMHYLNREDALAYLEAC